MASLKGLFKKTSYRPIGRTDEQTKESEKRNEEPSIPEGLWVKCHKCGKMIYKEDVVEHFYVCPECNANFRIKTKTRIRMVTDRHSFEEWFNDLEDQNRLDFPEYDEKRAQVREKTGLKEAVTIGKAKIGGYPVVLGICDARFLMGSMGEIVGEKITRGVERATKEGLPVVIFCCSGGARMQEGIISLMQMAKTSAALKKHSEAGLLYIPVLTDPTTGGVTASFAMLGDIILAEPGALIGFAGPRVIAQTIGQKLPEGFQKAEFLVEKGIIDGIVERKDLKQILTTLLAMHQEGMHYDVFQKPLHETDRLDTESEEDDETSDEMVFEDWDEELTPWERVEISRDAKRPTSLEYITEIFDDFIEMHGDRSFRDDGAVVAGLAWLNGQPVTVIGQQKGKNTKENIKRNFGMVSPEGYRKALRLMKQAEKFKRPIITFVDTPGAACGIEAEERGQGEAIATNLMEMSGLRTPVVSLLIGEGGSGGALGLAVANRVLMMENATYSILSPEGFATILWKDGKRAKEAAEIMKITAEDLKDLKIIDEIIPEAVSASEENVPEIAACMKANIEAYLQTCKGKTPEQVREERYQRFRMY